MAATPKKFLRDIDLNSNYLLNIPNPTLSGHSSNKAYSDLRLEKSLNLSDLNNADTAIDNLGATVVGKATFKLANPSAISFVRINADNSVTARSASNLKIDLSLNNIDNTSDVDKPVSTAQASADAVVLSTSETYTDSGLLANQNKVLIKMSFGGI